MRKLKSRVAILVVLALLSFASIRAQTYSLPQPVNLDPIVRRTFRSFYVRSFAGGPVQRLYTDTFFPIGWSRDGKFAYYIEPVDEECGCYFAELIIQDLRTDKIVWEFKNKPMDRVDAQGVPIPDDMRKLWKRNEKIFSEKLRENRIEPSARFTLLPAKFSSAGKNYLAAVSSVKGDDGDGLRRISKITLDLTSPTLGKKSLYSADYTKDMYVSPLDAAVAGVFKSPFENRAAVVMIKVQRGWEGPPHTVEAQIAGADLVSGFRK